MCPGRCSNAVNGVREGPISGFVLLYSVTCLFNQWQAIFYGCLPDH